MSWLPLNLLVEASVFRPLVHVFCIGGASLLVILMAKNEGQITCSFPTFTTLEGESLSPYNSLANCLLTN